MADETTWWAASAPDGKIADRARTRRWRARRAAVSSAGASAPSAQTRSRSIDYKDINLLRRYVSDQGQIESRRRTGTCARHQRRLTTAIKRARNIALLPYTAEHIRRFGG